MTVSPVYFTQESVYTSIRLEENPEYFKTHRHSFIEFAYVIKGEGTETINNRTYPLKPGAFSLILPYQVHTLHSDPKNPLSFYVGVVMWEELYSANGLLRGLGELLFGTTESLPPCIYLSDTNLLKMDTVMKEAVEAFYEKSLWGNLLFKARLIEALTTFDKIRSETSRASENINEVIHSNQWTELNKPQTLHNEKVDFWNIIYYIHNHYNESITLQTLAKHFHLSGPYISLSFTKHFGEHYLEFLNKVRIQNACALLVSTDMSITQIALEVGYESHSSFSRAFLKYKGVNASIYRKTHQ